MVGEDVEFDGDEPDEQPPRSYRLLAALSLAAVATVVLVPYAGLTGFGDTDALRTGTAIDTDPVDDASLPEREKPAKPDDGGAVSGEGAATVVGIGDDQPTRPTGATTTTTTTVPEPPPPVVYTRPIPSTPPTTVPSAPPPWWADSTRTTTAGFIATDVGCAKGTSAEDLDEFFRLRMGPVLGQDYQHVYPLGGNRYLWLFQDTFIDQPGAADELDEASFVHNAALMQTGQCFTLYHRGSPASPTSFEPGTGELQLSTWFWPMGGDLVGDQLSVFWAEMTKDADPPPGDGLGWHPVRTWLARYDAGTLERLSFSLAPNSGTSPIYGYAVASDGRFTYLFGNTYDENLARQGGWDHGPHSATRMWLGRVPLGRLDAAPEYRTSRGWSDDPAAARPIVSRFWAENPMQPRFLNGQWVAATKEDGFWGDELFIDVARNPWGPWTTASRMRADPRGGDPLMNTYQAHLMPWLDGGAIIVSLSQNARDMLADAFPHPERYRLQFLSAPLVPPPPPTTTTTTTTTTTIPPTTTTTRPATTTTRPTTTTTTTTTVKPPTTTTTSTTTTTTSTTTTTTSTTTTTTSTTTPTSTTIGPTSDTEPLTEPSAP